ncbi:MAG: 3-methyladenine DNA glycosylase [Verrucomicrobiia bacterium]
MKPATAPSFAFTNANPSPSPSAKSAPEIWLEPRWRLAQARHTARLHQAIGDYLQARQQGQTNPVLDFLFTYYRFPPSRLAQWHPGTGRILAGPGAETFLHHPSYRRTPQGIILPPDSLPLTRRPGLQRTLHLLQTTAQRPAHFACFGLHEWAMVYRTDHLRHPSLPLRLNPRQLADFIESRPLTCTHFDAYRFFSPAAQPRNAWTLQRDDQLTLEQGGCLHANMDLYKWAHKFSPWIGSDLILDCFLLALDARILDMRASPYDLRPLGYTPIPIETAQGRAEYEAAQRALAARASPLRHRLILAFTTLTESAPP